MPQRIKTMKKQKLTLLKYHWYYFWGNLTSHLGNSRWEWKANLFYPMYNRWMDKAADIDEKHDLGYWTHYNEDGTVKRAARK